MKSIHFIINPISGSGKHKLSYERLNQYFDHKYHNIIVKKTKHRGHATELTKQSINEKADIIVACGGDGTINEVASCLVKKDIPLGIIPVGSGNGLASNLKISKNIKEAIKIIKRETVKKIDVGQINTKYFFSNTGVGFDADVIFNYEKSRRRCLYAYLRAVVKSFKSYRTYDKVEIFTNQKKEVLNPFMIFISNSNEIGYKMSLTPKASLEDGYLDVVIIPKLNKMKILKLGFLLLIRQTQLFKQIKYINTRRLILQKKHSNYFSLQKDGEHHIVDNDTLSITLFNKSLSVIVPQTS